MVIAGFAGLAPMPRNRGLLSLRALKSVKKTFAAYSPASRRLVAPAAALETVSETVAQTPEL